MIEFLYNNDKNSSIKYICFKFNCSYYLYILYKKIINFCSKSKLVDKLLKKLSKRIIIY